MKKSFVLFLILIFIFSLFSTCFADEQMDAIMSSGVLKFGTSADYVPYVYYDGDTLTGLDIELMQEVGKRLGLKVQPIDMAFSGLIDSVVIGQVDIAGGALTVTDERLEKINFSRTYHDAKAVAVARKNSGITDIYADGFLKTARIGVKTGTSYNQWVASNWVSSGQVSTQDVFTYSEIDGLMEALKNGLVDLVILDGNTYKQGYESKDLYEIVNPEIIDESYAFAIKKGSSLLSAIDMILNGMINDGTVQSLFDKYFSMNFTEEATPSITRPAQSATLQPSSAADFNTTSKDGCINGMEFIRDVTIPDGTLFKPSTHFTKTWRLKNSGTCTWTKDYSLIHISGEYMGSDGVQIPETVAPGEMVNVSVAMTAPGAPNMFTGVWQMRGIYGEYFGQTVWVKIEVPPASTSGTANSNTHFNADPIVEEWQPDFYSGSADSCPIVYWAVRNANQVELFVDGVKAGSSNNASGTMRLCPTMGSGAHRYGIKAIGRSTASAVFQYTN